MKKVVLSEASRKDAFYVVNKVHLIIKHLVNRYIQYSKILVDIQLYGPAKSMLLRGLNSEQNKRLYGD
jgi:hypothetical protein